MSREKRAKITREFPRHTFLCYFVQHHPTTAGRCSAHACRLAIRLSRFRVNLRGFQFFKSSNTRSLTQHLTIGFLGGYLSLQILAHKILAHKISAHKIPLIHQNWSMTALAFKVTLIVCVHLSSKQPKIGHPASLSLSKWLT